MGDDIQQRVKLHFKSSFHPRQKMKAQLSSVRGEREGEKGDLGKLIGDYDIIGFQQTDSSQTIRNIDC
jgi:hypothetical protein